MSVDLAQFEAEAAAWGISLSDRMELESLCQSNTKEVNDLDDDDWKDFGFRSEVAQVLIDNRLEKKGYRYLDCGRKAVHLRCEGEEHHEFCSPLHCDLRFCPTCAPRIYAKLYAKHAPVLSFLKGHRRPGFRLREITLTVLNTGTLTRDMVKRCNLDAKKTLRQLMRGVKGWGAVWVDEVGFNNTNLHIHILFYGPYIEQSRLAAAWERVSGNTIAWIERTRTNGRMALLHLLKYVSKPPSDDAKFLGLLEVAFHGNRRVHAVGLFYNFSADEEDSEADHRNTCPLCGENLIRVSGKVQLSELKRKGVRDLAECRAKLKSQMREY
jgi:hypothetical protein